MITLFDHIFTPLKDNDLDGTLERFARAGFVSDPIPVRHNRGRLTGFVRLTGTYLEFLSVVDEREFNRESARADRILRRDPQPYGVGAISPDPQGIHDLLKQPFPEIPPIVVQTEGGGGPARWTLCMIPRKVFPGANIFAIKYHEKASEPMALRQGPNTIFALGGFGLCTVRGAEYRRKWETNFNLIHGRVETTENRLKFGGQEIEWILPSEYTARYGREYDRMYEELGAFASVKLLCTDRSTAELYLAREGFALAMSDAKRSFFQPDPNTGLALELIETRPEEFLRHYRTTALVAAA